MVSNVLIPLEGVESWSFKLGFCFLTIRGFFAKFLVSLLIKLSLRSDVNSSCLKTVILSDFGYANISGNLIVFVYGWLLNAAYEASRLPTGGGGGGIIGAF
jgi:hypothetical protein